MRVGIVGLAAIGCGRSAARVPAEGVVDREVAVLAAELHIIRRDASGSGDARALHDCA